MPSRRLYEVFEIAKTIVVRIIYPHLMPRGRMRVVVVVILLSIGLVGAAVVVHLLDVAPSSALVQKLLLRQKVKGPAYCHPW